MDFLHDGPDDAEATLILAHGAGAAMDTPFMDAFAKGVGERGIFVARFEFDYMRLRRADGKRRGPDREPKLRQAWLQAIDAHRSSRLFIGGKSMGGRIASLLADDQQVDGLVCLGYPFHPAGKPEKLRTDHLAALQTPALFVQGERDRLGNRDEVATYDLASGIQMVWLTDGDHSFKPRKSAGVTETENWESGIAAVAEFIRTRQP